MNAISPLTNVLPPPADTSARNDERRLKVVVSTHFDVMWRLLRRLGVPERELDDAVQEVVLVLARKLDRVEERSERAFVLSTAYRVASTMRRTVRRRREADGDASALEALEDDRGTPESLLEQRRARDLLDSVLDTMPSEQRVVFVLYELERMTTAEIAEALQIPAGTAASRLRRARACFEREVSRIHLDTEKGQP